MNSTDVADVEFEVSYTRDGKKHTYKGTASQAMFDISPDPDDNYNRYNLNYYPQTTNNDMLLRLKDYKATYTLTEKRGVSHTAEVRIDSLTEREVERARDLAGVDKDTVFSIEQRSDFELLKSHTVLVFRWEA